MPDKKKSWRTTTSAIALLVAAVLTAIGFLLDGNPETNPDWAGLVEAIRAAGVGGAFLGMAGGLLTAKDDKKEG